MQPITLYILSSPETQEGLGRLVNGLEIARDLVQQGASVEVVFDGAGTKWIPELTHPESKLHPLFEALRPQIAGVCAFCSSAYGVQEQVQAAGIPLLQENNGHPGIATRLLQNHHVLTF